MSVDAGNVTRGPHAAVAVLEAAVAHLEDGWAPDDAREVAEPPGPTGKDPAS